MGRLEFIPGTRDAWVHLLHTPEEFAREHGVRIHGSLQKVARMSLDFIGRFSPDTPVRWFGYLALDGASRQLVGVCGFKGPPVDGTVEIAYGTFSGFEGQGIATEMARFLVERARESGEVTRVIGHTLPERNASTSILAKLGMSFAGEAEEDGMAVWRWEMPLP
jgi:[ribosomal protein S5]-alanine N-acetyltransferase